MRLAVINTDKELQLSFLNRYYNTEIELSFFEPMQLQQHCNEFDGFIIFAPFAFNVFQRIYLLKLYSCLFEELICQNLRGKPIFGIAGGAQVLFELGIVPGCENTKTCLGIAIKTSHHATVSLTKNYSRNAFTSNVPSVLTIDEAIVQATFIIPHGLVSELQSQGLDIFYYTNTEMVAGIANKAGNAFAMLATPIDNTEIAFLHPIVNSMQNFFAKNLFTPVLPLHYYPRPKILSSKVIDLIKFKRVSKSENAIWESFLQNFFPHLTVQIFSQCKDEGLAFADHAKIDSAGYYLLIDKSNVSDNNLIIINNDNDESVVFSDWLYNRYMHECYKIG